MKNIWFSSDHHFGHKNIIQLCNRPFSDVDDMDNSMIRIWNQDVKDDDDVYYLGDFSFRNYPSALSVLRRLNGNFQFIKGNHDDWMGIKLNIPTMLEVNLKNVPLIVLCHYPMRSWNKSFHGSWHLFGHEHGRMEPYGKSFDVGVDVHDFRPWSIDQVIERMAR